MMHSHTRIHTYIHIFIHTYMHTYIHTYIHTCMHACMYVCMYVYISIAKRRPSGEANIIQIWHPCGVANMIVYPSWAVSPSGYALGWQCSRGVDNHVGNPTGMSYLFYYTEHPPPTLGHPKSMTSWNLQNSLEQCNFGAAGLPRWPCWDVLFVLSYRTTYHLNWAENLLFSLNWDTRACCSQQ